ncbi:MULTISPECIES: acyl carrier protein [unclassified Streptomyces]|uniref:acyl carrier protein n=1 Tax=unclassified Streptomyces TaxID=2593676 RepID=UPI003251A119
MAVDTAVEEVVSIYRDVLGLDTIGAHDQLPDLAIESMQVIRIATAVYERLGIEVPLEVLIESRTPMSVANALARPEGDGSR